ncbi:MAG: DUF1552 domain-containing protein [Verrucomicrobiota bacterium]
MKAPYIANLVSRRRFLQGAGVMLALPFLESFRPLFARAPQGNLPRRLLAISNNLGFVPKTFFPEKGGKDYALSPTLTPFEDIKNELSVFSGMSHPDVKGGHSADNCFLTAARGPAKSGFRNSISLDQYAIEKLGQLTRFPTLNLGVNIDKANRSMSWTRDGALLPAEDSALAVFRRMFLQGDADAMKKRIKALDERSSILDVLLDHTKKLERELGQEDRSRLDQYLTSVREVEERLSTSRTWELREKPGTKFSAPEDIQDKKRIFEKLELMLQMACLAFESDSTRIVTLMVDTFSTPAFNIGEGVITTEGYHGLSHHSQEPAKLRQLEEADKKQMQILANLLRRLMDTQENGHRLLDQTAIVYGTNMGDANRHDNTNLPIIVAGGGMKHGAYHALGSGNEVPLCNLFVSILQSLGIDEDVFGSSKGSLNHLLLA